LKIDEYMERISPDLLGESDADDLEKIAEQKAR